MQHWAQNDTLLFCVIAVFVHDMHEATDHQGIVMPIQGIIKCIATGPASLNQVFSGCACQQYLKSAGSAMDMTLLQCI